MKSARFVTLSALLKMDLNDGYSGIVFNEEIKRSGLDVRDIAFCGNLFYGVLEKKITLDYIISLHSKMPINKISIDILNILRMGLYQILYMDKVPDSAAVNESVKLVKAVKKYSASGFVNGILRSFLKNNKEYNFPKDKIKSLCIKYSCPEWIINLFMKSYGKDNTIKILESLNGRPPINIRVNNLKVTTSELIRKLASSGVSAKQVEVIDGALTLENTGAIETLDCYRKGLFHVQDLASQICCKALSVEPSQTVLDICASPGGKSFTMAEIMENRGEIFSFDIYNSKVELIKKGAKRLGINIINSSIRNATCENSILPLADRILCDVPCSGLGIIRRKPEIRYKDKNLIGGLPALQYDILCKSCKFLKVGGIIVYSTCTLNPAENNNVADKFLIEHSNFEPINLSKIGIKRAVPEKSNQLTLLPGIHDTDGFFISAFRRVN